MKAYRTLIAALFACFLTASFAAGPAVADGGDQRNKLQKLHELQIEEGAVEDSITVGNYYLMQEEFGLSLNSILILNLQMLNELKLREIRIQKAVLSRELLHIRMRDFFLQTPLGVAIALQSISIFTMLGTPIYPNPTFNFDPILWQASMTLVAYYFMAYLLTPEGKQMVHNLTDAMSYGQYGYDAVFNTQY